jgi:hypothetical protein
VNSPDRRSARRTSSMKKMNTNNYLPLLLAVVVLPLALSGCETPEPEDPSNFIPGPQEYYNPTFKFALRYPKVLNLKVEDRSVADVPALYLKLGYPGNDYIVFELETYDPGMRDHLRRGLIEGSEKVQPVDGETGSRFEVEVLAGDDAGDDGENEPEQHVIVERYDRLYVFTGKGETFDEVLDSFRFIEPAPIVGGE